jgi:hypothetical protein
MESRDERTRKRMLNGCFDSQALKGKKTSREEPR